MIKTSYSTEDLVYHINVSGKIKQCIVKQSGNKLMLKQAKYKFSIDNPKIYKDGDTIKVPMIGERKIKIFGDFAECGILT